jgi:hypothetical protein
MSEQGIKGPFADVTTDVTSGRALHSKDKSRGDRPPYGLRPPVGIISCVLGLPLPGT